MATKAKAGLPAASREVFDYVKENGGRVAVSELVEALDAAPRSINGRITALSNKKLVAREKVPATVEGEKDITYVVLTEEGKAYDPDAEVEE